MIDFHSHILPEVDDGSSSVEMSLAMLEAEAGQGIDCVVVTPHFYAYQDMPEDFLARRENAQKKLSSAMEGRKDLPRILLGAEVSYYMGMSESDVLPSLCIEGTNYLLVEMPLPPWPERAFRELQEIHERQKLIPVIAHVERYLPLWGKERFLRRLEKLPVCLQVNAGFFLDRRTSKAAMHLMEKGRIHFLGSDAHNIDFRPPRLGEAEQAIRSRLGDSALDRIFLNEQRFLSAVN